MRSQTIKRKFHTGHTLTTSHTHNMVDSTSSSEDEQELAKLQEATAGVSKMINQPQEQLKSGKKDYKKDGNDVPARHLSRLLDDMLRN